MEVELARRRVPAWPVGGVWFHGQLQVLFGPDRTEQQVLHRETADHCLGPDYGSRTTDFMAGLKANLNS